MIKPPSSKGGGGFILKNTVEIFDRIMELTLGNPAADYVNTKQINEFSESRLFQIRRELSDLPRLMYKLYGWNFDGTDHDFARRGWAEDLLLRGRIRLSSRCDFNDPFDTYPSFNRDCSWDDIRSILSKDPALKRHSPAKRKIILEKMVVEFFNNEKSRVDLFDRMIRSCKDEVGIFCLTENVREVLMWSHYSCSHKGFGVVFQPAGDLHFSSCLQPVIYSDERPVVYLIKGDDQSWEKTCLHKSDVWRYENEWRYVSNRKAHTYIQLDDRVLKALVIGMHAGVDVLDFLQKVNEKRHLAGLRELPIYRSTMHDKKYSLRFFRAS